LPVVEAIRAEADKHNLSYETARASYYKRKSFLDSLYRAIEVWEACDLNPNSRRARRIARELTKRDGVSPESVIEDFKRYCHLRSEISKIKAHEK